MSLNTSYSNSQNKTPETKFQNFYAHTEKQTNFIQTQIKNGKILIENVTMCRTSRSYKSTLSSSMPDFAGRELGKYTHHFSLSLSWKSHQRVDRTCSTVVESTGNRETRKLHWRVRAGWTWGVSFALLLWIWFFVGVGGFHLLRGWGFVRVTN